MHSFSTYNFPLYYVMLGQQARELSLFILVQTFKVMLGQQARELSLFTITLTFKVMLGQQARGWPCTFIIKYSIV